MGITTLVKDIAIQLGDYPHIDANRTISEAVNVLRSFAWGDLNRLKFSELLVMDRQRDVVGRVRLEDILEGLEPRLFEDRPRKFEGPEDVQPDLTLLWEDAFEKDCRQRIGRHVKEIMIPIGVTVQAADHLLKALYLMVRTKNSTVPVTQEGKVVGVIRMEEIFYHVSLICNL